METAEADMTRYGIAILHSSVGTTMECTVTTATRRNILFATWNFQLNRVNKALARRAVLPSL